MTSGWRQKGVPVCQGHHPRADAARWCSAPIRSSGL